MNSSSVIVNKCVGCGIDMGESNPRQYCYKTYCPDEEIIEPWVCGECTITNYEAKCLLCDNRHKSVEKTRQIGKIALSLANTARAKTNI